MLANKQPKYEKARSDESDEEFGLEMQEIDITSPKSKHVIAKHRKESFSDSEKVTDEASLVVQESSEDEIKVKREDTELASDFKTFGNTVISFIGSGILGLPFAFRQAGLLLGLGTLVAVSAISVYAMLLLVKCKYELKKRGVRVSTYGQVGEYACGRIGARAVDISLVITQSGFCIAYLIFISKNLEALAGIAKPITISLCVPALVLLSLLKHLKQLAPFALFADLANFVGLAVVYLNDFEYMPLDHDEIHFTIWGKLPFFFGVAIYCYEGVGMVLPLENSMQNKDRFQPILVATVALVTCLYGTFGMCGYLAFGDDTKDVITLNMPGSVLSKIVKLSLCVGLYFTYPMMLFPVFEVLEPYFVQRSSQNSGKILRVTVVVFTAFIAAGIPNFGLFISFLGSTCCSLLAFMLPTLFYYRICGHELSHLHICFLVLIFLAGVVSMLTGFSDVIYLLIQ